MAQSYAPEQSYTQPAQGTSLQGRRLLIARVTWAILVDADPGFVRRHASGVLRTAPGYPGSGAACALGGSLLLTPCGHSRRTASRWETMQRLPLD